MWVWTVVGIQVAVLTVVVIVNQSTKECDARPCYEVNSEPKKKTYE